jgi:hypothetical protein
MEDKNQAVTRVEPDVSNCTRRVHYVRYKDHIRQMTVKSRCLLPQI